jgi:hypothetical protein
MGITKEAKVKCSVCGREIEIKDVGRISAKGAVCSKCAEKGGD